jgi:hypothetical protein
MNNNPVKHIQKNILKILWNPSKIYAIKYATIRYIAPKERKYNQRDIYNRISGL